MKLEDETLTAFLETAGSNVATNAARGNGFSVFRHAAFPDHNLFDEDQRGFYFEHIMSGELNDEAHAHFSPDVERHHLERQSANAATLVYPALGSTWAMETRLDYVLAGTALDLTFTTTPHHDFFGRDYALILFASYINDARDRRIHFWGVEQQADGSHSGEQWVTFGEDTPDGFESGPVGFLGAPELEVDPRIQDRNFKERTNKKFVLPFYYGLVDGDGDRTTQEDTMAYVMMFDRSEDIRFVLFNFTTRHLKPDPTRPAWDWQYVIRNPTEGQTAGYRARMVYTPFTSPEQVKTMYLEWAASLATG